MQPAALPSNAVVLLAQDAALDPAVLRAALARRTPGFEVVGFRDPAAREAGPAGWWGATLPVDALRAVGGAVPEAGAVALADLVLRAETAGFRHTVQEAPGPVPRIEEADRLRLALLHAPLAARTRLLVDGLVEDVLLLRTLRVRDLAGRREALRAFGTTSRLALWAAWPALRRRTRDGVLDRALPHTVPEVAAGWPHAEQHEAGSRPAAVRLPAWPTTRRGTSAA